MQLVPHNMSGCCFSMLPFPLRRSSNPLSMLQPADWSVCALNCSSRCTTSSATRMLYVFSQVNRYFHATVDPQAWPTDKKAAFVEDAQHWWRYNMFYMSSSGRQGPAPYIRSVLLNSNGCACFSCFRVFPKSLFSNSQTERVNAKSNQSMTRFCLECGIKKEKYRCGEVIIRDRVDKSEKCFTLQTSPAFLCGFCKSFRGFRYDGVCASCYEHDDQCGSPFNTDGTFSPECLGSHQT